MTCHFCGHEGHTEVKHTNGSAVWLWVLILFILGWFFLFCWFFCCVPCCVKKIKDAEHYCKKCDKLIAVKRPDFC